MTRPIGDVDAESKLLGAILYDERHASALPGKLTPACFVSGGSHGLIFEAILELRDAREPINPVTVAAYLKDKKRDDQGASRLYQLRGGAEYLSELVNTTAAMPPATFAFLAARVVNLATQRKLQLLLARAQARAGDPGLDVGTELAELEKEILGLSLNVHDNGALVHIGDALRAEVTEWVKRSQTKEPPGIPTGFRSLDREIGGLHGGELIVLGARPGMGKTSLVTSLAIHVSRSSPMNVAKPNEKPRMMMPASAIFSLEMPRGQMAGRMLCTESGLLLTNVRQGRFDGNDLTKAQMALSDLRDLGVYIDDASKGRPYVSDIISRSRRLAAELERRGKKLRLIVVDYIQIVRLREELQKQRHDLAIGEVSLELKALAKELDTTVVACAQLNRSVESRTDKRPGMADLRDSGQIEQDADQILMLYRDEYYNPKTDAPGVVEVIIEKNRHGRTGTVCLRFDGPTTSFSYDATLDPS
jgi:replicative DNA helicase